MSGPDDSAAVMGCVDSKAGDVQLTGAAYNCNSEALPDRDAAAAFASAVVGCDEVA